MLAMILVSAGVLALVMVGMAIGVILQNKELRGSCGGVAFLGPDGDPLTCSNCNCKLPEEVDDGELGAPVKAVLEGDGGERSAA